MSKVFVAMVFFSCVASLKTKESGMVPTDGNYLDFLKNYESSVDSVGVNLIVKYNRLNLIKEVWGNKWLITNSTGKKIFSGDYDKCRYLTEVYNGTYLLVSCVAGKSHAAGPDTFERDSVFITNIITGTSTRVKLPKIYLTRSRDFLFKSYSCPADTFRFGNEYYRYCAIDSIDLKNHKLVLINECRQTETFDMIVQ